MRHAFALIVTLALFPGPVLANVLKTETSICHCPGGQYYDRIRNATSFPDLASCLSGGGREPKRGQGVCPPSGKVHEPAAGTTPQVAMSRAGRYDRESFGNGWSDENGNCMNTRHEMLRSLSTGPVSTNGSGCSVVRGRWIDPYTDRIFTDPSDLDIDHIVPLSYAWSRGADLWTDEVRERFANDPVNLLPVDASTNRRKSDSGPLEWLPPNEGYRCEYVLRFARIAKSYGIAGTAGEELEIREMISDLCS